MKKNKQTEKEICCHCISYDMWCGICLNPESESFKNEEDLIGENPSCEHFKLEESFAAAEEEEKKEKGTHKYKYARPSSITPLY